VTPVPAALPVALQRAWQSALAAEHQAIFGYDVLGPRLPAAEQALAHRTQDAHRAQRAAVEASMATLGLAPVAPLADYPALYPVPDAAAAHRLAVHLEDACAAAWRYLYLRAASPRPGSASSSPAASGSDGLRGVAQQQLTASAVRATRWRVIATPAQATVAFPGL
jgi:hypothetical protein